MAEAALSISKCSASNITIEFVNVSSAYIQFVHLKSCAFNKFQVFFVIKMFQICYEGADHQKTKKMMKIEILRSPAYF